MVTLNNIFLKRLYFMLISNIIFLIPYSFFLLSEMRQSDGRGSFKVDLLFRVNGTIFTLIFTADLTGVPFL